MSLDLKNKTAIITGASLGIGKETALKLAEFGSHLVLADINEEEGNKVLEAVKDFGVKAKFLKTDVSIETEIIRLIDSAKEWGRLDIMINNAGIGGKPCFIHKLTNEIWDKLLLVDLTSVFWCQKYATKAMLEDKKGGSIVNISSIAGLGASPSLGAYAVAKAGVIELTLTGAVEVAKYNIRINAVCPGWTETAILDNVGKRGKESMVDDVPMGRLGRPEEVANLIRFLASEESSFITGSIHRIDGGIRS
jgi:NAD(P)-dependent dehydrogenase (short-subunit alcohol dehydrogenase family)